MKKSILISGLFLLLSASGVQAQQVNDFEVINALMDSVLNTRICHRYFDDIKKEQFGPDTARWNEYAARVITSKHEYDSLPRIMIVFDSLTALKPPPYKDQMLADYRMKTSFRDLIASYDTTLQAQLINTGKHIKVSGADCFTREQAFFMNHVNKFGKVDGKLYLGTIQCSRVYFDAARNLGFYYFSYLGNRTCGYTCYVFFSHASEQWKFEGIRETGVF